MTKTFDQLRLELSEDQLLDHKQTSPSKAYRSFFVLEPITHKGVTRVSVTARDEKMNLLWGSMICEGHLPASDPTPVALYSAMRSLIRQHLQDPKPRHETTADPYVAIEHCCKEIEKLLSSAKLNTLGIKKRSDKTNDRAAVIADSLWDALRLLSQTIRVSGIVGSRTEEVAE